MPEIEYIKRLIEDLKNVILAKSAVISYEQSLTLTDKLSLDEINIITTCDINFPNAMKRLMPLFNLSNVMVSIDKEEQLDLVYFLQLLENNYIEIADNLKKSHNYITSTEVQCLKELFEEQLDYFNKEAKIIEKSFQNLLNKNPNLS